MFYYYFCSPFLLFVEMQEIIRPIEQEFEVFKELFEDYIKNNKNEILSILKDDVIDSLRDDIEAIQYDAEEALNMAEEALSMMMGKKN